MKYSIRVLALAAVIALGLGAHDIITTNLTYTRDISRIFERRCVQCHGPSSSIPLTNYQEVRPWAVGIKEQVLSRAMPPWGAVKGFGNLAPDHALSQEEIMIIAAWVIGGAPQGDPALLPKKTASPNDDLATPAVIDVASISTRSALKTSIRALGIRPQADKTIESARIIAQLPDGRLEPLVWLYHFDPKSHGTFLFREPLNLPAGTVVQSSAPLTFVLETASDR